ncbi:type IV secretion system DNA-binding domain-containing protein [Candidatus Parcubacteria bacterium]|nr:type IV secretion system DNA-binding domain-containing protein [Candidatus Parcubacteria bacterium]
MDDNRITYFGLTDTRNKKVPFGIKAVDRTKHVYVIGKTGMGKSTLLENMAIQDIQNGDGLAFIDPHGGTAEKLLDYIPEDRVKDVLYFAPFDMEYPIGFNVIEDIGADRRHLVVSGLMSAFHKIWEDAWSARMEYILQNTVLALLEFPGATMMGINKMLTDKAFRNKVVESVKDPGTKSFWVDEFAKYTDKFAAEATPAIQNKVGQFTSNPLIRNIVGQENSTFDIRKMMDEKKILIINLSKGKVGESNANLLGSMLITKIYLAAMSRADVPADKLAKLPNFYLYVDEFQSFANESFADILSEARKYKLNLTIAHQYVEQMSEEVRAAVIGNVGTLIAFRVGAIDAELFEKEFAPHFLAEDIVNLGIRQIYLKLMIDGVSSTPFSATTMPPIPAPALSFRDSVIANSRMVYAKPRAQVEVSIAEQTQSSAVVASLKPKEAAGPSASTSAPRPTPIATPRPPSVREDAPRVPSALVREAERENFESKQHLTGLRAVLASVVKEDASSIPSIPKVPPAAAPAHRPPVEKPSVVRPPEMPRPPRDSSPPRSESQTPAPQAPRPPVTKTAPSRSSEPSQNESLRKPPQPKGEVRGGKTANKELLHAALQEALKKQNPSGLASAPKATPVPPNPLPKEERREDPPESNQAAERPAPRPKASHVREVPEDELKRLLE